jgi:TRAP-type mannitol/chloroaromatic compound transport system permease large subunit
MTSAVDIFNAILTVGLNMAGLYMGYTVNFDQLSPEQLLVIQPTI